MPTAATAPAPGLALATAAAVAALVLGGALTGVSALIIALVLGVVIGNAIDRRPAWPYAALQPGLAVAGRTVLRFGVVLLGLRLSLGSLVDLGAGTLAIIVATVAITFFGVQYLGARLGLGPDLSLLVASGFSICGASAIAAVKESTTARDDELAASVGLVTAAGTLSLFTLPALGGWIGLSDEQLAIWLGAAIQDVAQVVAAGSTQGEALLAVAVAVKLTRVSLLAPIVAGVSMRSRGTSGAPSQPLLPWFVIGFTAMVALRTTGLLGDDVLALARSSEKFVLAVAMVGLGSGVRLAALRTLGARPLLLGALGWLVVSGASLAGLALVG